MVTKRKTYGLAPEPRRRGGRGARASPGWRLIALPLLFLGLLGTAFGQKVPVPVKQQYSLLTKILTFDRTLKERASDSIVIAILYQVQYDASRQVKTSFVEAIESSPVERVRGLPINFISFDVSYGLPSAEELVDRDVTVLYVAPLRGVKLSEITELARASQATTVTGVADYVDAGLAFGILTDGAKPIIHVNLTAAKEEGANFSSQLLKLAKVTR